MRRTALILMTLVAATVQPAAAAPADAGLREVMFVGNNWAGTASIVDAHTHKVLKRGVNLIPDKQQELADIASNPVDLAYYLFIQQGPGEGHDQYVDDMFTTTDGRYLAVSRPSFADVVWVDIAKAIAGDPDSIVREQQMDGQRTDHMGLSPNGQRLLVERLHRAPGHRVLHGRPDPAQRPEDHDGRPAALVRVRRDAAREQLLRRRRPGLPRLDRAGLHARRRDDARTDQARSAARRRQGRPLVRDRAHLRPHGHPPLGHGQGARRGRAPRHELGGPADGDRARRALHLLPGVLLPRDRRVRHPGQGPQRRRRLRDRREARAAHRRRHAA